MFLVWDQMEEDWAEDICILNDGTLVQYKNKKLRKNAYDFQTVDPEVYTVFNDLHLFDKEGELVYEGSILELTPGIRGVVLYQNERARFLLFDYADSKYYEVNESLCLTSTIVGHIAEPDGAKILGINIDEDESGQKFEYASDITFGAADENKESE